jgi:hypothetical protein
LLVIVTPGQLSLAVGGVQVTGLQAVKFAGQFMITGSIVSDTVTLNEQLLELPAASVITNVLVVVPTGNSDPLASPFVCVIEKLQLSLPVGAG